MSDLVRKFIVGVLVVLAHFVPMYFAASAFLPARLALGFGVSAAIVAMGCYIFAVEREDRTGRPSRIYWFILGLPVAYVLGGIIWWGIRLVLEYFDNWPPRV